MDAICQIHADALVPGRLPAVMASVGSLFGAESSFLFTSHSGSDPNDTLIGQNMSPDDVSQFAAYWSSFDPWALAAQRRGLMKKDVVVVGTELIGARELAQDAFYNDFGRRAGMGRMLGSVLFDGNPADGVPFTNLCWYRPHGRDDFGAGDRRRLRYLLPHLQQAVKTQRQVRRLGMLQRVGEVAATMRPHAWLLLDDTARVIDSNVAGARLLQGPRPLARAAGGRVTGLGRRMAPDFASLFAAVRATGCARDFVTSTAPSTPLLKGSLVRLPVDVPCHAGTFFQPSYLLTLDLPRDDRQELIRQAASLHGLSDAEGQVFSLLLDGLSAEQIALRRGSRLGTVRSQLRAILDKTGCSRQLDVIRMMRHVLD